MPQGTSSSIRICRIPARMLSGVASARAHTSSRSTIDSVATAAAAHSGLELNVPWWPIFSRPAALAAAGSS